MWRHAQVAGGGRSSARETIGRVAAGALAKKLLRIVAGVEVSNCPHIDMSISIPPNTFLLHSLPP